jgi:hypothetical protein
MIVETLDCKQSSNLRWARYDPATKILEIDFKNKSGEHTSTYAYDNFPPDGWTALQASPNPGRFFAFHIRNAFKGRRLDAPPAVRAVFASGNSPSKPGVKQEAPEHLQDSLFAIASPKA